MTSKTLISFLIAISAGTWLYSRLMQTTGNNNKTSLIGAAIAGLGLFILGWLFLGMFLR